MPAVALPLAAPSGFPQNVQVVAIQARLATLSWNSPLLNEQNGVIINYVIICGSNESSRHFSTSLEFTVPDVLPFSTYACTVAAITEAGEGPPSLVITFTTLQDGEGIVVSIGGS